MRFNTLANITGANVNFGNANYVENPFKVFRVQDCTLGAVGGAFGSTHNDHLSASQIVSATSAAGLGAKMSSYHQQLTVDAALAI